MSGLRVVTLNTAKCDEPYWPRLAGMAHGLAALDPDVVALQECFACEGHADTAAQLARALGMHRVWAPARRKARGFGGRELPSDSGLALLTRWPALESSSGPLPSDPADGERIGLLAVLEWAGVRVLLANVHLTHLRDADALRREQLRSLLAHPWFDRDDLAARLVCGDFNTSHDRLEELTDGIPRWDIRDCFVAGGGKGTRTTLARAAAQGRERCVDFVLSLAPAHGAHPWCTGSRVVLDVPSAGGVLPSDHFGVMTTVAVPSAVPGERGVAASSP